MLQQQTTEAQTPQFTLPPDHEPSPTHTPATIGGEAPTLLAETLLSEIPLAEIHEVQTGAEEHVTASASALNALIKQELRLKRRDDYVMLVWTAAFTLAMFAVTHRVVAEAGSGSGIDATIAMICTVTFGMVTVALITRRSYRRKTALTQELSKNHDTALIGPLVDTLNVESTPVRNLSKRGLIPLLPTLKASDADLLTDARRARLLRLLAISPNSSGHRDITELFSRSAYRREVDLRVSILKAFEQTGGAKELATVERLSRGLPGLQGGTVPAEVRQAAAECLLYLQSRVQGQRASEQLLRPSSADTTSGDVLLRPASSQIEVVPEQMLRASKPDAA